MAHLNEFWGKKGGTLMWVHAKKLTFCFTPKSLTQLRWTRRAGFRILDTGYWIQNFPIPTNLAAAAVYLGKYFEPFKQFPLTNMRKLPIGGFTNKLHRKIFVKNGQHMLNLLPTQMHKKYLYKLFLCTSLNISAILKPPSVESWKSWKSSLAHFNQP